MQSQVSDFRLVAPLQCRRLPGLVVDVWHVAAGQKARGHYLAPDPRLVVFLDPSLPPLHLREQAAGPDLPAPRALLVPAGVPLWSRMEAPAAFRHLDLHIKARDLDGRLQLPTEAQFLADPSDLLTLAEMIAREVCSPGGADVVLEGLVQALIGKVLAAAPVTRRGGLAPWQVAAVEGHLRAHLTRTVTVAELAEICGLSESWFAHGFRQTLGQTPQRWQLRFRLQEARAQMEDPGLSLSEIAHATGFSDHAHLSRAFRQAFGQPPSAWRRSLGPAISAGSDNPQQAGSRRAPRS